MKLAEPQINASINLIEHGKENEKHHKHKVDIDMKKPLLLK